MDFDSLMQPGRLPEKPWRTEALVRLIVGIVFCCFAGAAVATAVRYFDQPNHPATLRFICFAVGAFACFVGTVCVLMSSWPYENFLGKLLALLLCIYGGLFFMWLAYHLVDEKSEIKSQTINMLISILALQGMAVVLVHFFLRGHHTGWGDGFGLNIEPRHALLVGITVGLCALPATWGLEMLSNILLRLLAFHPQEQEAVQILRSTEGWQNRLVLGVATIIIAPVAEEILFRGILYPFIKRIGYPRLAWWFTALIFAAVHVNLTTFIPLAFLAFVLIWLYEHTGNLLACIATHSLFNAANFIALYFLQN